MEQSFNEKTEYDIERDLARDVWLHQLKVKRTFLVILIILLFIFRDGVTFWIKFGLAFPTSNDVTMINVKNEPIQQIYSEKKSTNKAFSYTSLTNKKFTVILTPKASYKMSCMPIAYNYVFLFNNNFFDATALYDLGCVWGDLADKNFFKKNFKSYSEKTAMTGGRFLWIESKNMSQDEFNKYLKMFSHTHMIPANSNVMAALLNIKVWQNVEVEGQLVDMDYYVNGRKRAYANTSLDRVDTGAGACEIMYVTKVKIGDKVYQ